MRSTKLKAKLIKAYKKKGKEDLKLLEELEQARKNHPEFQALELLKKAKLTEKDWQEIRIIRKEES